MGMLINRVYSKSSFLRLPDILVLRPKLNGVRAEWDRDRGVLLSKGGNIIKSCNHVVKDLNEREIPSCDGELYIHKMPLQQISGLARRYDPAPELKLFIYELKMYEASAHQRMEIINKMVATHTTPNVKFIAGITENKFHMRHYYDTFVNDGFEGLVMTDAQSLYEDGKSNNVWKWKPVKDMEAKLVGFNPATTGKNKQTFGSMILELPNGIRFKCSGMTPQQRREIYYRAKPGDIITFGYENFTSEGKPVFPRFIAIRYDMSEEDFNGQ